MWLADLERVRGITGLLGCVSIACRWAISCALEALDWESSRLIWRLTTSVVVVVMVRGSLSLTLFPFQPSQFLVIFETSNIVGFPALVFLNSEHFKRSQQSRDIASASLFLLEIMANQGEGECSAEHFQNAGPLGPARCGSKWIAFCTQFLLTGKSVFPWSYWINVGQKLKGRPEGVTNYGPAWGPTHLGPAVSPARTCSEKSFSIFKKMHAELGNEGKGQWHVLWASHRVYVAGPVGGSLIS